MPYSYTTLGALKAALLQRLQDQYVGYTSNTGSGWVSPTEAGVYIQEALQTLNALASLWNTDFVLDFNSGQTWQSLNMAGSPRIRTITDTQLYITMQYHLIEPPTGGTWTGSTQFNITSMSQALQFRRDELMQISGANTFNIVMASPTSTNRTTLPDSVLDLRRVRWIPQAVFVDGTVGPDVANAYPLSREDTPAFDAYGAQNTITVGNPDAFSVTANQPLQFDCSTIPPVPGQWDILAVSGASTALAPPAATVLQLPNDWCWVAKWGALADLMSNSVEGADRMRAKYCIQRYERGKKAMLALPWLIRASADRIPVDTPSFVEADAYRVNWEWMQPWCDPQLVVGGMDMVAMAPFADAFGFGGGGYGNCGYGGGQLPESFLLTLVGNAPTPTLDTDTIQLARDGVDAILAYAQHIAMFKTGGAEFSETIPLYEQFEKYCAQENKRYEALGITRPLMIEYGSRDQDIDPRFEREKEQQQQPQTANAE